MQVSKQELSELYKEYEGYVIWIVKMFLLKYPKYRGHYDDLLGECCCRFVSCIDRYDPDKSKLVTYLMSQMSGAMRNYIRSEIRYERSKGYSEELVSSSDVWTLKGFNRLLRGADLSEQQERRLRDRYILGMTCEEIAKKDGVRQQSVWESCSRALEKIKQNVSKELQTRGLSPQRRLNERGPVKD
jgi:RNA polymerase sigma factor (sigma-70 family)